MVFLKFLILFLLVLDLQKSFRAAPSISKVVRIVCQPSFLRINHFVDYAFACVTFLVGRRVIPHDGLKYVQLLLSTKECLPL